MSRRLPPLNALRAFEAAARHGSVSRAADELCVTHGAVSKQVDALEDWLQTRLFRRVGGRIVPTEAGSAYAAAVAEAFARIAAATDAVDAPSARELLEIQAPPTFTARWLMPRLARFSAIAPGIELRLTTGRDSVAAALRRADVVIRRGPPVWKCAKARLVLAEAIGPVCHPRLLRDHRAGDARVLSTHPWLEAQARSRDWNAWLRAAGLTGTRPPRWVRFDHNALAIDAALDALGIVMAPLAMVREDLVSGRLVAAMPGKVAETPGYYALHARGADARPAVAAFIDWLVREGAAAAPAPRPAPARKRAAMRRSPR